MTSNDWKVFVIDLVDGLCHLHSKGIIHTDIKSDNILLSNKRGYIIDLGKACRVNEAPKPKKYKTQYSHVAPEVLNGRRYYSKESDIFKLAESCLKWPYICPFTFLR